VIRLIQTTAEVVTDKKRVAAFLVIPGPLLKSRSIVVLPGAKAAVRLQQAEPIFYVQSADGAGARLELISLKVVKESRVVEKVEASRAGVATPAEQPGILQVERTQLAPGLYRLKPLHPLDPGEYALGELGTESLKVEFWAFGDFETPSKQEMKKPPPSDSERE